MVTALSSDETGVVDMIRMDKESPAVAARGQCPREMTACTYAEKSCCGKSKTRAPPMPCTRRLTLFNWIKLHNIYRAGYTTLAKGTTHYNVLQCATTCYTAHTTYTTCNVLHTANKSPKCMRLTFISSIIIM